MKMKSPRRGGAGALRARCGLRHPAGAGGGAGRLISLRPAREHSRLNIHVLKVGSLALLHVHRESVIDLGRRLPAVPQVPAAAITAEDIRRNHYWNKTGDTLTIDVNVTFTPPRLFRSYGTPLMEYIGGHENDLTALMTTYVLGDAKKGHDDVSGRPAILTGLSFAEQWWHSPGSAIIL